MPQPLRLILAGTVLGAAVVGLVAAPALLPPALADAPPPQELAVAPLGSPFDTDRLIKPDFAIDPEVSTEVLRSSTVRKIGYGRTTIVKIAETASGTYSSDALTSAHIRYPGIHVDTRAEVTPMALLGWESDAGWRVETRLEAGSFVTLTRFEGGQVLVDEGGSCVLLATGAFC